MKNVKSETCLQKLSVFLAGMAMIIFLVLGIVLALSAHAVTVHEGFENYPMNELVVFWRDSIPMSFMATAAAAASCLALCWILRRSERFQLNRLLWLLWASAAIFWVWGTGLVPRADSERVVKAALMFAQNDYSPMRDIYFNDYSYQLGICFVLEIICRLLPEFDLAMVGQIINVVLCVGMVSCMVQFTRELMGLRDGMHMSAMSLLFLPMPLYCTYVYGTIPMMALIAGAFLCFLRYTRREGMWNGLGFAVCMGLATVMKPNAMVAMIALLICAVLHAMNKKQMRILVFSALMVMLCLGLPKLVIWQYEMRSGLKFSGDLSMLSRLVMGFQRSATGAGWFNNYTEQYSTWLMDPAEARVLILADLKKIYLDFAAAPMTFVQFMAEKCASLWLEPTYSVLWHGVVCDVVGHFNGLANMVYLGKLYMPIERVMDAFQQTLYVLSCIGAVESYKKRQDPVQILLPVLTIGGFLYHAIFEAKSQYVFFYAFFLLPLAAQGLYVLEAWLSKAIEKIRK